MNIELKKLFIVAVLLFAFANVKAQDSQKPEIGKPIPAFVLSNLGNYKKTTMASEDFNGRHVIIDFWNKNCVSCVQSFPKLNQLHALYKDKGLDIILVGTNEDGIEPMFEKFKTKLDLKFAYAYNMPLYENSVPSGAPHLLWIDDKGIVKAITPGNDLTTKNIDTFISGEKFEFTDHSHQSYEKKALQQFDITKPFLFGENGGSVEEYESNLRYRSLITEYLPGNPLSDWPDVYMFRPRIPVGVTIGERTLYQACVSLEELYRMAYTGYAQWHYHDSIYSRAQGGIIFELSDQALFKTDVKTGQGFYWYSLVMPKERNSAAYVMRSMQHDLYQYFGYEASLETRKFPYLKIVATDKAKKMKTKGGKTEGKSDHIMFKATNIPLNNFFVGTLNNFNYWETKGKIPVIINETGIDFNIDVDVKINTNDFEDVKQVYKQLGLEFVPAEKEFKVLVIRDPK